MRCLLIHPEFTSQSFWNYRATCEAAGAKYPAAPLGLITVAAMLPDTWTCRLVDCNVEPLSDDDLAWADLVLTGGMIAQQRSTLALIERARNLGKTVVVGGPDPTSSPHVYDRAHHLVLGEGEVTLPRFLADWSEGTPKARYEAGEELADVTRSPLPRFDLLTFSNYLHVGIQYARGCPFLCEFCDIIELFGRRPRLKGGDQMLAELERLYELGYRGHVDFVDDNFIGNRKELKTFLPRLATWLERHRYPFEFSTEASINLVDDEELLEMMQAVGFAAIFVGVESPDEETLAATRKRQNTHRDLAHDIRKIYDYGIFVNTGYIVGFDTEHDRVAEGILGLIEASLVPVNMVGLMFALPNTQLSRRLTKEGRLHDGFEFVQEGQGDQCTAGLNFDTKRPRIDILRDYRRIIHESYAPEAYFHRVLGTSRALNCTRKKLRLPWRLVWRDLKSFGRLIWRMGVRDPYRRLFWKTLFGIVRHNPRSMRYGVALMALYLHFGVYRKFLVGRLDLAIADQASRDREAREVLVPARVEHARETDAVGPTMSPGKR
ncbi:MAG: B12-binding domain-containing radical SAM protein [Planctomycetes bacterium]|nr:B12-binding domain-containing radical SAM protein [Planctomycetota bacterium]